MIRLQRRSGTFLPTLEQHHLLRAALLEDPAHVRESFELWKSQVDLDRVEHGSMRLLPLLYRNLKRIGTDDPMLPRLKGVYRQVWFRNQLMMEHGARVLHELDGADIPAIVLKGAALIRAGVYDDAALRPMEDFDVLVRPEHFVRAVETMLADGWTFQPPLADPEPHFVFQHAIGFRRDGGGELDLHWSAMGLPLDLAAGAMGSQPVDQLLQICAHATRLNEDIPPIRWAADAYLLLQNAPIPWDTLAERARERSLSLIMLRALEYLRDGLGAAVPDRVLTMLEMQVRIGERIALTLRNARGRFVYVQFLVDWMGNAELSRLPLLPRFLRSYCRVDSTMGLVRLVTSRLALGTRRQVTRETA